MMRKLLKNDSFLKLMGVSLSQLFLLMFCVGMASAKGVNVHDLLEKRISVRLYDKPLKTILSQIEAEANLKFVYSSTAIEVQQRATVNVENQPLKEVLDAFFKPLQINYRLSGSTIILNKNQPSESTNGKKSSILRNESELADIIIKGKVTDAENGEPIPGVNVSVKGTTRGTSTNNNGEYTIAVTDSKATILFSFVGYTIEEVLVGNKTTINISLKNDLKALDEVVVIGYGTIKKSSLTGSVSKFKDEKIDEAPVSRLDQALQGKIAGVQIQNTSSESGANPKITIRGLSSVNAGSSP